MDLFGVSHNTGSPTAQAGAGWIEFDLTNGLIGGTNLIRVGVARDPKQGIPLQGSYDGAAADFIDMTIEVTVSKLGERP